MFFYKSVAFYFLPLENRVQANLGRGEVGLVSCKSHNILLSTKKVTQKGIEPSTSNPNPLPPFTYQTAATFYISTSSKLLKGEEEGGMFLNTR